MAFKFLGQRQLGKLPSRWVSTILMVAISVSRRGQAGRSTRRWFCGRIRAGRVAGALGRSGVFAILCRDNARWD